MRKFKFTAKIVNTEVTEEIEIPESAGDINDNIIRDYYYDWLHQLVVSKIEKIEEEE